MNHFKHQGYTKPILAAAVSIPILAAVQAAYFLGTFRLRHKDAPHPITPCRGLLISKSLHSRDTTFHETRHQSWKRNRWMPWFKDRKCSVCKMEHNDVVAHERPLSLLVIGDSLAAGVGSTAGTPILPESIAKSLSAALGGIPVLWECHGTPGAVTSHVLQEIEGLIAFQGPLGTHTNPLKKTFDRFKRLFSNWMKSKNCRPDAELFCIQKHYDIVVLLTGMNDLKMKLLPFMNHNDRINNDTGFYTLMQLIIKTLSKNMKLSKKYHTCAHNSTLNETEQSESIHNIRPKSVIVLPSFPTNPIPMLKYPPLCWILQFCLQVIDEQKHELALEYAEDVLFVDVPSKEFIHNIETRISSLEDIHNNTEESIVLNLKDVSHCDSEATKDTIQKHALESVYVDYERENEIYYEASLSDTLPNERSKHSKLISFDGIHPNNYGYDLWGRHIADKIICFWKRRP